MESEAVPAWRRWLRAAGVNWAVVWVVLTIVARGITGPLIAFLIALRFSPAVQGYYYTFASIITLQMLVEMGLSQVLTQFASHEAARLRVGLGGAISGDPAALSRLRSLAGMALRWYAAGGVVIAGGLGSLGGILLSRPGEAVPGWEWPWGVLCLLAGLRFPCFAAWALLEGCNEVKQVNAYRLVDAVVTAGAGVAVILLNGGLWASVGMAATGLACGVLFLAWRYRTFFAHVLARPGNETVSWKREVWPFQWRLGLTSVSGYLAISFFTPVLFHFHGSELAGQMGMSWSFALAVSTVASAWVHTRIPTFGALVATRRYSDLDRLFLRILAVSLGVALLGSGAILAVVIALSYGGHPLARRVLPPFPLALFLGATVLMHVVSSVSANLRSYRREPFLTASVLAGVLVAVLTVLLGRSYGAIGMASGYLCVVGLFLLPVSVVVWFRRRRQRGSEKAMPSADAGTPPANG